MKTMPFDNKKYIQIQKDAILSRIQNYEKLYIEVGGKIFDDYHASRDYLRIVSDCICQYYGLSVLEDKIWKHKGAYKRFAKFYCKSRQTTFLSKV